MHLDNFDLNLLVAIEALMRRRSVTEAAEELHITQSALSSALKRARQHFCDEIFYYDGQHMVPTSFGRELEHRVPDMINQLRILGRMRAHSDLRTLNRAFTIIASDYVSAVYISALSKHLSVAAPGVTLSVVPFAQEALSQFQRGVIDFMIAPEFAMQAGFWGAKQGFQGQQLFQDSFNCVLWQENPLLKTGFTEAAYFASPQIVTNFFLENGKSHFERWLVDQNQPIKIAASLPSFIVLPHYVTGTLNVATIHTRLVGQFSGLPGLVFVEPPTRIPKLTELLITTKTHKHDSDARLMADVMLEIGQSMQGAGDLSPIA